MDNFCKGIDFAKIMTYRKTNMATATSNIITAMFYSVLIASSVSTGVLSQQLVAGQTGLVNSLATDIDDDYTAAGISNGFDFSNSYATSIASYPAQPIASYPAQPIASYPAQPIASYPAQPIASYPAQLAASYPAQSVVSYPAQSALHPAQSVASYPAQSVASYPIQPVHGQYWTGNAIQHPQAAYQASYPQNIGNAQQTGIQQYPSQYGYGYQPQQYGAYQGQNPGFNPYYWTGSMQKYPVQLPVHKKVAYPVYKPQVPMHVVPVRYPVHPAMQQGRYVKPRNFYSKGFLGGTGNGVVKGVLGAVLAGVVAGKVVRGKYT